ncbi:MAG: exosortase T [Pseudomonadota bacterium]
MNRSLPYADVRFLSVSGFALASAILAIEPLRWLIHTWREPSYASSGWIYLALCTGLVAWSVSSPRTHIEQRAHASVVCMLLIAAGLRLVSQVAAINIVGGMALALDVFALLTWAGLGRRKRALSPFWMAVLFLFALPFERVAQRVLGYPMQEASAFGACHLLSPFFPDLVCEGVRLRVGGQDVLVDLPCSGSASLMLALATVTVLNALFRPRLSRAAFLIALTIVLAIAANALRIALLAVGLVVEPVTGLDVMAAPAHDLIGTATLVLGLAPVVWLAGKTTRPAETTPRPIARVARLRSWRGMPFLSAGFVVLALVIVGLPRQALDVSRTLAAVALPSALDGAIRRSEPLSAIERAYFETFGGTAQKANYGPMGMTIVQTTSPLRHLHGPDECLRGLGYSVTFIGTRFEPVPTAIYKAEDAEGRAWKVAVTFTAANGFATSNVAEAIWQWMQQPGTEWRSVQRITPWTLDDRARDRLERAAIAALDLT